jgi:predicted nucleic acid-binding protein
MIEAGAKVVIPTGQFHACRDATDDMVLETALIGRAKYIVSRDADVTRDLSLVRVFRTHGIRILTVDRLLHLLSANR